MEFIKGKRYKQIKPLPEGDAHYGGRVDKVGQILECDESGIDAGICFVEGGLIFSTESADCFELYNGVEPREWTICVNCNRTSEPLGPQAIIQSCGNDEFVRVQEVIDG